MEEKSGARRAPYGGTLEGRPLAVLLAHASGQRLCGLLTLVCGDRRADIWLDHGRISRIDSSEPAPYLGAIMYELGMIDGPTLDRTLAIVARTRELHGQVLVREGAVTEGQLDEALRDQSYRRLHQLFAWPDRTAFVLRMDIDELGPPPRDAGRPPIDPWRGIWRGVRAYPPESYIEKSLGRVDGDVHVTDLAAATRLGLYDDERELCERISKIPVALDTLVKTSPLGHGRTRALLWCIALTRALKATSTKPLGPAELGVAGIRARARDIAIEDPWTVLGLPRGAGLDAARAAYFRLARQWHPDRLPPELGEARDAASAVLAALCDAHRAISDLAIAAQRKPAPPLRAVRSLTRAEMDEALARGDRDRARAIATQLARGGVDGPDARAVLAWCDAEAGGDVAKAIAALDRVVAGDPDCVRALFYRAKLHEREGRIDVALRDLRRVTRLDPGHGDAQRDVRLLAARTSAAGAEDRENSKGSNLQRLFARVATRP